MSKINILPFIFLIEPVNSIESEFKFIVKKIELINKSCKNINNKVNT